MDLTELPIYWTLRSIARVERRGDLRQPRLTEPGLARWQRMRRKLNFTDLIALLHEDLATAFPCPFDLTRWSAAPLDGLDDALARQLVEAMAAEDSTPPQAFLRAAARALGLPAGGNIADLPKVQPHQRALELSGTGGRVALQQAVDHGVSLGERFTFVADTDAERLCVGLAVVEARASEPRVLSSSQITAQLASGARFDQVFGLSSHGPALALAQDAGLEVRWT